MRRFVGSLASSLRRLRLRQDGEATHIQTPGKQLLLLLLRQHSKTITPQANNLISAEQRQIPCLVNMIFQVQYERPEINYCTVFCTKVLRARLCMLRWWAVRCTQTDVWQNTIRATCGCWRTPVPQKSLREKREKKSSSWVYLYYETDKVKSFPLNPLYELWTKIGGCGCVRRSRGWWMSKVGILELPRSRSLHWDSSPPQFCSNSCRFKVSSQQFVIPFIVG